MPKKHSKGESTYAKAKARLEKAISADPASAGPRLELGTLAFVAGDFETAEVNLMAARDLAPDAPRAGLRLADLCVETGRPDEAAAAWREVLKLKDATPLHGEAAVELELVERELELVHRPLDELRIELAGRAPSATDLNRRGCRELLAGRIEPAAKAFRKASESKPATPEAALNFGFVQGLAAVEPPGLKRSAREIISAIKRFPNEPRLYLHLAEVYESSSLYDPSIMQIEKALDADPSCVEAYDIAARYALLGTGGSPPLEEKIDRAVARLKVELAPAPEDAARRKALALGLVGRARYRTGVNAGEEVAGPHEPTGAREDLDRACALLEELVDEPNKASDGGEGAAIRLAECREKAGDVERAEELLTRAAENHPRSYRPRFELGGLRLRTGRPNEAVDLFAEAVALAPEEATVHQSLRYALTSARRLRLAEFVARERLARHPDDTDARVALGRAYVDAMRLDTAVEVLAEAAEIDPDASEPHTERGRAYVKRGRPADAEASFRRAVELDALAPEPHRGLGNLLLGQPGRMREGVDELDLYRKLRR